MASQGGNTDLPEGLQRIDTVTRALVGVAIAGGVMFLVVIGLYFYSFAGPLSTSQELWGQFGDYLGGTLNPLFTFLTLLAILFTIVLQARELHFSTTELRHSSQALRSQSHTLQIQQFENAFFQLLHLHNAIVNELDLRERGNRENVTSRGRDCFRVFVDRYKVHLKQESDTENIKSLEKAYDTFYRDNQHEVGHYFRLLYNIVKFVDRAAITNKKFYTNLIRAQLSADELTLLFWNCLSQWGREKFKPLVERYALLKTLPERPYFTPRVRSYYNASAYAGS